MPPNVSQIRETLGKKNIEKAPISSHKTEPTDFLMVKIQNSFFFFFFFFCYCLIAMLYVLCKLVIQDIS